MIPNLAYHDPAYTALRANIFAALHGLPSTGIMAAKLQQDSPPVTVYVTKTGHHPEIRFDTIVCEAGALHQAAQKIDWGKSKFSQRETFIKENVHPANLSILTAERFPGFFRALAQLGVGPNMAPITVVGETRDLYQNGFSVELSPTGILGEQYLDVLDERFPALPAYIGALYVRKDGHQFEPKGFGDAQILHGVQVFGASLVKQMQAQIKSEDLQNPIAEEIGSVLQRILASKVELPEHVQDLDPMMISAASIASYEKGLTLEIGLLLRAVAIGTLYQTLLISNPSVAIGLT